MGNQNRRLLRALCKGLSNGAFHETTPINNLHERMIFMQKSRLMKRLTVSCWTALVIASALSAQTKQPESLTFPLISEGDTIWVIHYAPRNAQSALSILLIPGWPAVGRDILGLGSALSAHDIHAFVLQPRGHGKSGGEATFGGALEDVRVLWEWLAERNGGGMYGIDPQKRILSGYSWGGSIALSFSALHSSVTQVISFAGTDNGVFIRRCDQDAAYTSDIRKGLESTRAPRGPVRFDLDHCLNELRTGQDIYDLVTIAPKLAKKKILLVSGTDDEMVELEHQVLPFYRALKKATARDVHLIVYETDHSFRNVRDKLAETVLQWIGGDSIKR